MAYHNYKNKKGFSLIEVLVVSAILLTFFTGLFGSVKYTLGLVSDSKAKLTALTVANDQMEYIRSLSYNAVGTVAGIPAGLIPQLSTTTLNTIEFQKRVLVEYIDDDADGLGAADSNGITTDYKQVKVSVTWNQRGVLREVFLISNIIPRSIETSVGGGTLRVNVLDADVVPLPGASVRVLNTTIAPNIDVTRTTDSTGIALFGGAPAGPNYEIFVSRAGYSNDRTYFATTSLPNPATQPVAVLEADISTMNFFIDELSQVTLRILSARSEQSLFETFSNMTGIATSTNIVTTAGDAILQSTAGVYATSGVLFLQTVTPSPAVSWTTIIANGNTSLNTTAKVRMYTGTSTYALVPESDLPGNAVGFEFGAINISVLPISMYPSLTVGITLTTSNTSITPRVSDVLTMYRASESVLTSTPVTMRGAKTIGTDAAGAAVFKNEYNGTTNISGKYVFSNIEWDAYNVTSSGYDIAEACSEHPLEISPGLISTTDLLFVTNTAITLRVAAETSAGLPLRNATVTLSRPGFSETYTTGSCGQVFFSSLVNAADYQLVVVANGYTTQTQTNLQMQNDQVIVVQF